MAESLSRKDVLYEALKNAFTVGAANSNYMVDIAGSRGVMAKSPTVTNVPNTLTVSAHGSPKGYFAPDDSSTNAIANAVREVEKSGEDFRLKDIASAMGSATNDVKRAVISSCFAAGYNFDEVKKLFPNLEQLVAPGTDLQTSGAFDRHLSRPVESPRAHALPNMSPLFSVTPTSTNIVGKTSDWLTGELSKQVTVPLSTEELASDSVLSRIPTNAWSVEKYSSTPFPRDKGDVMLEKIAAARLWQTDQFKNKNLTSAEISKIAEEAQRRIAEARAEWGR